MNNLFDKFELLISDFDLSKITGATTNLQDALSSDIAFYRLFDTDEAQDLFKKRLEASNVGLVIVSQEPRCKTTKPYVVLNFDRFEEFQYELVELLYPKYKEVEVIGVTGTNGKSTVVHLCQELIKANGKSAFSIGTIGVYDGEKEIMASPGATTPSFLDLSRILHTLNEYDFVCLEVSSHALVQKRLGNIKLSCAGWTNLTQDHLDYHKTMQEYFEAKLLLKNYINDEITLSPNEKELESYFIDSSVSYKKSKAVDYSASDAFRLEYNKKNLSLAVSLVAQAMGREDLKLPKNLSLPKGRYNTFRFNNSVFVVDYAHTPDAIENVCSETRKAFKGYHIVTVFGCGGNRDRSKRPKMLKAALTYSDEVVVTTDNPRFENPEDIICDIVKGSLAPNMTTIVSREDAIAKVVQDYAKNTIVIIAGKGHEEYQDIKGVKGHFSDIEQVKISIGKLS